MQNFIVVLNNTNTNIFPKIMEKFREFNPSVTNINPSIEKFQTSPEIHGFLERSFEESENPKTLRSFALKKYTFKDTIIYEIVTIKNLKSFDLYNVKDFNDFGLSTIKPHLIKNFLGSLENQSDFCHQRMDLFTKCGYFYFYGFLSEEEISNLNRLERQAKQFKHFVLFEHIETKLNIESYIKLADKMFYSEFIRDCNDIKNVEITFTKSSNSKDDLFLSTSESMVLISNSTSEIYDYIFTLRHNLIRQKLELDSLVKSLNLIINEQS